MPVKIIYRGQEHFFPGGLALHQVLARLEVSPATVIVLRNGQYIQTDARLEDGDIVRLIPVTSGG
jgi:sulfur carrier protein ThiS